ncbi:TonB-dependent receptor [Phenylobacterium montanum]|uniref:TonB-dependent receptor n=1 Tax=Phenylobacterium montanum TaxID=2823693 RepID=A0A975IXP8_9CAUL|nr:TonB-dependent receptor [Caulobacter sp. S6]QUD89641.1 TonB-dependent receptor [Caulobacter sp. S6]
MRIKSLFMLSAGVPALALAAAVQPAWAADQPASPIQEVVVTANRTESLASKTPIALTAVTGQSLKTEGVTNPTLLAETVPNLSIDRANGLQITIRGVTSTDGTEKGDPSASFLLDGIYIARPQAQEVSFFDIDRVEVLRGPQGTLYGRNTTAGVVNVISAKPKFAYAASADVTLGDYSTTEATAMVNLPLNDVLALRVAGNYDARDSYVTQAASQSWKLPKDKDNASARVSLLYKPNDRLNLLVRGDVSSIRGVQSNVLASNFFQLPFQAPVAGERGVDPAYVSRDASDELKKTYADVRSAYNHDVTWGVMGELNWSVAGHWTFTWLGGYRGYSRDDAGSSWIGAVYLSPTLQPNIVVPNSFTGNYNEQSQEVRVAYSGDRLKAQAGLYYFREHYGIDFLLYGLISQTPGAPGYFFGFPQTPGGSQSVGEFGQATYSLTDRWRITAGVRATDDDKFRHGATIFHGAVGEPFNPATDSLNDAHLKTQKVTWKAGTDFDLTPATMLYFTASTGYRAGGFNDGCAAGMPNCNNPLPTKALYYQPETLTAYEAGVKSKLLHNTLRLTADYFHYDYNNLQLSQVSNICGGPCQVTTNAASAEVDGLELEGLYAFDARNRFDFSATWLDARYADWEIVSGVNFAGLKLDHSPDVTLTAGYTYTQPLSNGASLIANVRTRYSDRYAMISTALRAQFWQPGFTKTDLSLTYSAPGDVWYLQGFVRNLEDSINVTNVAVTTNVNAFTNGTVNFGDPRTWGVRFGAKF